MANYRLKAYESFILREGWITKAIFALSDDPKLFQKNSGADSLGVGTNMAKAIRYWLRVAGIAEERANKGTFLTEFGTLILKSDPYLEDAFTLFIIHCNIARNAEQATSWNIFFNDFEAHSFTRAELESSMMTLLIDKTGESKLPERSVKEDCSAIIAMYCDKGIEAADPEEKKRSPFCKLGLLTLNGNAYEKTPAAENSLTADVIFYLLADTLNTKGSILIDDIINKDNMPGKLLNLSRISVNEYLDILAGSDRITVNRTAGLDVVYPKSNESENGVVLKHYEEN